MVRTIIRDTLKLNRKAQPATKADLGAARDLLDTLIANADKCAGLAANMIGENKRIIAFFAGTIPIVMINPKILSHSEKTYQTEEGCLSLDGMRPVTRYESVVMEFYDMMMKKHKASYSGFTAEVIQHELDHCSGILI